MNSQFCVLMEESINDDQASGRKRRREKRHNRKYSDSRNILDTSTLASVPVGDTVPKKVAGSRPEPSKLLVRNQTFTRHPFYATSNENDSDSEEIPEDLPLNNVKKNENRSSENRKLNEAGVADKTKQSSSENKTLFPSSSLTRKSIPFTTAKLKSDNIGDTKKCNYRRPWQYKENEVLKNVVKENTETTQNDLNVTDEDSTEQFSNFIDTDVVNVTLSEEFDQNGPRKTIDRSSERETSFCDTGQADVLPTNDTQNGSGVRIANRASTQKYSILDRQMPNQSCVEILSSSPYFDSENNKRRREKRSNRKYSDSRNILDTNTLASVPVDDKVPKNVAGSRPEPSKLLVRNQTFTRHPFYATSNENDSDFEEIPEDLPLNNVKKNENGSSENRKFNEAWMADKTNQSSSENKTLFPSSSLTRKSIPSTTAKLKSDNIEDTKKCNYRRPWQYKENEVLKNVVKENAETTQNDLNVTDDDSTEQFTNFIDTDVVNVTLSEEFAQNGPHKTTDRSSEHETSFCDTGQADVLPTNDTQNDSGVIMASHASTQTYSILDRQMPNQTCVEILSSTPYFDSENNSECSAITKLLFADAVEVSTQTYSESDAEIKASDQSSLELSTTNGTNTQTIGSTNAKSKHTSSVRPKVLGLPGPGMVTQRDEQVKGFHELIDAVQDIETLLSDNEDIVFQSDDLFVSTADIIASKQETCSDVEVFSDFVVLSTSNGLRKTAIDTDNVIGTLKFEGAGRMCKIRKEDNLVAVLVADGKSYIAIVNVEGRMSFAYCLVLEQTIYSDISHIDTYFDKDQANTKNYLKTRHVFALSYSGHNAGCQALTDFIDLVNGTNLKQGCRKFQCPKYKTKLHKGIRGISFKDVSGIYGMASDRFGYLFIACSYHLVYVNVYKKEIIWKYQFKKSPSDVSCCGCLVAVSVKDEERIELRNREGTLLYSNILDKDLSLQPHRISVNEDRLFLKVFDQTTWEAVILPCDIKKYSTVSD